MMYERPPTNPFQNPPRNITFPFQNNILMFQQHQDESLYDAWTHFKNLIQRVPYHGLSLWSLTQFFYDHIDRYTKIDINYAADAYDEPIGDIEDKVDNPSPQSTSQVLLSFEVYTLPVTYPKEVDETMGISMEVEPLDHTKIEDLGLNTCSHDLSLCSREILSIDEPKPKLLPNFSPLDVNLGDKRGTDPPINPYSPDSLGRHPVTKNVNPISLIKGEEEKSAKDNVMSSDSIKNPNGSDVVVPLKEVEKENEAENGLYLMRRSLEVLRTFGWLLEEIHVTWAQLERRNRQDYSTPKSLEEFCPMPGDGVIILSDVVISCKRRRQEPHDSVRTQPPQKKP
ncbi:hypothetical protein Tco_0942267 [Tanacetum coccineum]